MVITAYTLEECNEDYQVINETVSGSEAKCIWSPETNPFRSKIIREVVSSTKDYRENQAWLCFMFGCSKI
jgi:hypothetical protein